jgi:3-hydroxybutyryl-CoA dehydratase
MTGESAMKFKLGDTASISRKITDEDIEAFAQLTGDYNPVHLDEEFARATRFGRRIAHGMLSASLISSVLANKLPGRGSVYLSQTLKFVAPVYPDDTVTARVTIIAIREDKPIITLETVCENQRGETVIKGEAVVLLQTA